MCACWFPLDQVLFSRKKEEKPSGGNSHVFKSVDVTFIYLEVYQTRTQVVEEKRETERH
jgi:hypothetical protein